MKRALMWLVGWALVGIVGGLIWHSVAKPAHFELLFGNWLMGQFEMSRRFFVDGWFLVIGLSAGCLIGLFQARRGSSRRQTLNLVVALVGSLVASVVAWRVGLALAPSAQALAALAKDAAEGAKVPDVFELGWVGVLTAWPMGCLVGFVIGLLAPLSARDGSDHRLGGSHQIMG